MKSTIPNAVYPYQKENLSYLVEEYIYNKILRGEYKGGDRVLEADIADEIGISRSPVREGMKAAEQAGLLSVEPRKGASITILGKDDFQEVFEIRVLLENTILEDLILNKKLTDEDFNILNEMVDDMVKIVNSSMEEQDITIALNKKDIEFHQYLWVKSGSKRKRRILEDLFYQLRLAMLYDTKVTGDLMVTATDHYNVLKYLREENLEDCKKALKEHIVTYYSHYSI